MSGDATPYVSLITSEHADKPKFTAMVGVSTQGWADGVAALLGYIANYDLDTAIGAQLDTIGQLVGVGRNIEVPLTGVYFSLDVLGLGLDQGYFRGPTSPISGVTTLPDEAYRLLLRARIANNHWNGSIPDAYTLGNVIFQSLGYQLSIQDHGDLTMSMGLLPLLDLRTLQDNNSNDIVDGAGASFVLNVNPVGAPSTLVQALLRQGYLDLKPAGVRVADYSWPDAPGTMFAFDLANDYFDGFNRGRWATVVHNGVPKAYPVLFAFDLNNDVRGGFDDAVWADHTNSNFPY